MQGNLKRLAAAFTPVMHRFHHLALALTRVTDFSLPQYRVLMLVHHQGAMTINDLKQQLSTAQSTASEMVERLVKQDLLSIESDPDDRRRTVFKLTPHARRILKVQMNSLEKVFQRVLAPLDQKEQIELLQAFETILKLLERSKDV